MLKEFSLILTLLQKHSEACETIVKSASLNTDKLNYSVIKHELDHYHSVLLSFKYEERVKAKGIILEQRIERILKWRLAFDDDSERKFEVQMIILKSWYSKNEITWMFQKKMKTWYCYEGERALKIRMSEFQNHWNNKRKLLKIHLVILKAQNRDHWRKN